MSGASTHNAVSTIRMKRLPMASLWRLNRRRASRRGERWLSSTPSCSALGTRPSSTASTGSTGSAGSVRTAPPPIPASPGAAGRSGVISGIADPWVKYGVQDVGDQVEQDDRGNDEDHPWQHDGVVPVVHGGEEQRAHPGP